MMFVFATDHNHSFQLDTPRKPTVKEISFCYIYAECLRTQGLLGLCTYVHTRIYMYLYMFKLCKGTPSYKGHFLMHRPSGSIFLHLKEDNLSIMDNMIRPNVSIGRGSTVSYSVHLARQSA